MGEKKKNLRKIWKKKFLLDAHSQGVRHGDIKSDNVMLAMPHREIKVNLFTVCIVVACFF